MAASPGDSPKKFGTFTGVFTPTLLTILGVIMYVRLGWVVGNAGLAGTFLILGLGIGITACTGLSLSSIATNTRLGAGGPYDLIARSLGLEVGGSIGVPLYLSRPLGVAMYIIGFREGWQWIFPDHPAIAIDLIVFVALFGLALISANFAFRVQFLIMAVIGVSLAMIVASPQTLEPDAPAIVMWGDYIGFPEDDFASGADFWIAFAVFFPATTGILAGANMSGDLVNPRRSIPVGTLWAIGVSTVIYFGLAVWLSRAGTPAELSSNYTLLIDKSLWAPGVLAGLLGATFSSALAGAVGGPRILMAMGRHNLVPRSALWARTTRRGEPRNAVLLTAGLTFACLMVRDLNLIAPLVTMFFLITYLMINVVLLIESSLGLASFRPSLTIPRVIPLLGAVGCVFVMFIVNPTFGLIAVGTSIAIYVVLSRRAEVAAREDVRSSIFVAVAEWAAARVEQLGGTAVRAWKPNLLVPVEDPALLRGEFSLLLDLCKPEGTVKLLGLAPEGGQETLRAPIERLTRSFRDADVFARYAIIGTASVTDGVMNGLEALQGAFFRPNILFLSLPDEPERYAEFADIIVQAHQASVGVLFFGMHRRAGIGQRQVVNLWLRPDRSGWDVDAAFAHNNLNLTLLMGYRLGKQWDAQLNLLTVVDSAGEVAEAEQFLAEIKDLARIPDDAATSVLVGSFLDSAAAAPQGDMNILGLRAAPDFEFMQQVITATRSSCLFVSDSGRESARA